MNVNLNKETIVIVKNAKGEQLCRIEVGAATLTKTGNRSQQILELFELKPQPMKSMESMKK